MKIYSYKIQSKNGMNYHHCFVLIDGLGLLCTVGYSLNLVETDQAFKLSIPGSEYQIDILKENSHVNVSNYNYRNVFSLKVNETEVENVLFANRDELFNHLNENTSEILLNLSKIAEDYKNISDFIYNPNKVDTINFYIRNDEELNEFSVNPFNISTYIDGSLFKVMTKFEINDSIVDIQTVKLENADTGSVIDLTRQCRLYTEIKSGTNTV